MRIRFALLITLIAADAFAVAPQFWRVRSLDEFLAGDVEGFAVTSRGELRAGPSVTKVASISDPFVLSQAAAADGDHFLGTGNAGQLYRLHGTEMKAIFKAPEPEIYAVAYRDGVVYAATSPNGKIYRVDPTSGKSSVFFDPKQAYIWALQFASNGDLLAGTGVDGKLFRISRNGEGKVIFTAPETHVRSLAVGRDGAILAGGSGKGRIYEIQPDGTTHALYDAALTEISSIYIDANGTGWAAGVSNVRPAAAPKTAKPGTATPATAPSNAPTSAAAAAEKADADVTPSASLSFSLDDATPSQSGTGELYRITPDGFVQTVRKFDGEMVYAITGGPDGSILLSTGPHGRIYSFKTGELSLIATVPEKQVVSLSNDGTTTLITTTNSGAVYRMQNTPSAKAEYRSAVKDVDRFSYFGHYRVDGNDLGNGRVAIAFRSGNTKTPDATWTPWSAPSPLPEGNATVPAGRYVQWKLTMPKPSGDIVIHSVSLGYINRNLAPVIDSLAVLDPAVVVVGSSYPSSPQVLEATNPDEYGIFTSLDTPREKFDQGKKLFRRGYRTVSWRAHDENSDSLRYSLWFRPKQSTKWLRLRENLDETQMNFDTSQLPDGNYELRLVVTDATDNADKPLSDTKEGVDFVVDNTPPEIAVTTSGNDVMVRVTDKLSIVGKVEYSADAQKWIRLAPLDGVADSGDETYRLDRSAIGGKYIVVRAVDSFYNVATAAVSLP
jgi:WD40 repeat protein